ncbi:MAG: hypothetical protein IPK17_39385 [Chloroflexi bacterium]|uniref:hypothetical protein n=1 Tax=Candidatus Flexifilum breve TaxID=3140694 RepID=UPI00313759B9|nr:hypothetical protein [Chloroflexota bacterium]
MGGLAFSAGQQRLDAPVELALAECWLMVLIWSKEAAASNYVRIWYRYFLQRETACHPRP